MSPSIAFGGLVVLFGAGMLMLHSAARRRGFQSADISDEELRYLERRNRRRMQTSGLLVLIGVLIPLGDEILPMSHAPGWFAVYWTTVLLLTIWVAVLGVSDLVSTSTHGKAALARVNKKRRELEHEVQQLTNMHRK